MIAIENRKLKRYLAYKNGTFFYHNVPFLEKNSGIILFKTTNKGKAFLKHIEEQFGIYTSSMFRLYVFPGKYLPYRSDQRGSKVSPSRKVPYKKQKPNEANKVANVMGYTLTPEPTDT